jgi:uroporphyrinogen III methyltransferase / synthase
MSHVVATREAARAAPFLDALAPLGLRGLALPVTTTVDVEPAALDAALAALRPGDRVGLASARASALVAASLRRAALPIHGDQLWAVGDATAAPLRQVGYPVRVATTSSASGLAAALLAADGDARRRVLLPRAEDGRDEAAAALRRAGVEVVDLVVYRTVALDPGAAELAEGLARWRAGEVAVACLFAPSQVVALADLLTAHGLALPASPIVFAAIGDTTAVALCHAGVQDPAVAAAPTPAAMANAVASRYPPRR